MLLSRADAMDRLKELIGSADARELGWPPGFNLPGTGWPHSIRLAQAKGMRVAWFEAVLSDAEKRPRPRLEEAAAGAFLAAWESKWAARLDGFGRPSASSTPCWSASSASDWKCSTGPSPAGPR